MIWIADSPPWGKLVGDALNRITNDALDFDETLSTSVIDVAMAFHRQADEEKVARLQRKNLQCMDRLAKVQAHKRQSIISLRDSYGTSLRAAQAADSLLAKINGSLQTQSHDDLPHYDPSSMVPVLSCNILSSGSPGTVYVTAYQLIVLNKFFGSRILTFVLSDITMEFEESSVGLPVGICISCKSNEDSLDESLNGDLRSFSFIPSIGSERFLSFVDIVKTINEEDPDTLKFTARGGILYMQDDASRTCTNSANPDDSSLC